MEKQPEGHETQEASDPPQKEKTADRSLTVFGPYEVLTTRIFDELIKVLEVFARWVISLAIYLTPKQDKDIAKGAMNELDFIDGYLAKFVWSLGILATAIKRHYAKKPNKEAEEAEQEL